MNALPGDCHEMKFYDVWLELHEWVQMLLSWAVRAGLGAHDVGGGVKRLRALCTVLVHYTSSSELGHMRVCHPSEGSTSSASEGSCRGNFSLSIDAYSEANR